MEAGLRRDLRDRVGVVHVAKVGRGPGRAAAREQPRQHRESEEQRPHTIPTTPASDDQRRGYHRQRDREREQPPLQPARHPVRTRRLGARSLERDEPGGRLIRRGRRQRPAVERAQQPGGEIAAAPCAAAARAGGDPAERWRQRALRQAARRHVPPTVRGLAVTLECISPVRITSSVSSASLRCLLCTVFIASRAICACLSRALASSTPRT